MDDQLKRYEYYKNHILEDSDTFKFSCSACGKCCRKREEPIILTSADIFRLAKYLKKSCGDVILEKCDFYLGKMSNLPVVVLKEKLNGSCVFLHHNECSVHDVFLTNCRIYPLGRMMELMNPNKESIDEADDKDLKFSYFIQPVEAPCGTDKTWTLKEYLDKFHVEDYDSESKAWTKAISHLATKYTQKLKTELQKDAFGKLAFLMMYIRFDTSGNYVEQLRENIDEIDRVMNTKEWQDILRDKK